MKILMLLDNEFPPDVRVESEAQSLLKQGHSVHILSYNYGNKLEMEIFNGIQIHRFRIQKQVSKKALGLIHQIPLYKYIWKKQVCKILNSEKFDAVHIHDLPLCFLTKFIRENNDVKVVADMHENYPYLVADSAFMNTGFAKIFLNKKIWFKKEKEWLMNTDEIVCVAEEMKNRLNKVLGNKKSIHVVPNTLNFDSFLVNQVPIPELKEKYQSTFNIIYIGGFDTVRGLKYLIEAAAKIKSHIPELKIILVGDGIIRGELQQQSLNLGLEDIVIFVGQQPSSSIQAYIEIADICTIPHIRSEQTDNSSPNKLFQYMFFKKPVISSNCVSLEKIINQENCGLIFKDKNSNDLADKIFVLYQNSSLKVELGNNGYEAVKNKFNWGKTVQKLLTIYN